MHSKCWICTDHIILCVYYCIYIKFVSGPINHNKLDGPNINSPIRPLVKVQVDERIDERDISYMPTSPNKTYHV